MNTFKLNTGIETLKINEETEVSFNPSDINFFNRIYDAFDKSDKIYKACQQKISGLNDWKAIYKIMGEADTEIRGLIDDVFGVPLCVSAFGNMHITSRTEDGVPIWADLLMQIIDMCDVELDGMESKMTAKVKKYTDKYTKKYHK